MTALPPLTSAECWALLGDHDEGRVAYTENALPTIVPVPYTLLGNRVVLRCRTERMAAQLDGQVVAFQVDEPGAGGRRRSVVVTGRAERLTGPTGAVRLNVGQVRGQLLGLAA